MEALAWFATTPEGEQLGRLAAQTVRIELTTLPIWFAPLELFRWFISFVSAVPHAKDTGMVFATLSGLAGVLVLWRCYQAKAWVLACAFAAVLNVMLTLSGLYLAMGWLTTVIPFGTRWVVPKDAPFVLANLHTHTQVSNGFLSPKQAVLWHYRKGYRVIGITDSNTVRGGMEAMKFVRRSDLPVTIVVGEEFRGATHLLLLNIRRDITPRQFSVRDAIREAKKQGGIVIAAHVWTGRHDYANLIAWGVDSFEVTNGTLLADEWMLQLCKQHRLGATGNLDFRGGNRPLTATVLPKWATTPKKVQEALLKGHCAALYFPDRAIGTEFNLLKCWRNSARDIWEEGKHTTLLGFLLWLLAAVTWWHRRLKHSPQISGQISGPRPPIPAYYRIFAFVFIIVAFTLTVALGIWSMAWDLKSGWYPSLELVLLLWCGTCPVNWWLMRKMV